MLSSQGGQPSGAFHRRRLCYQCRQEGHYAKSCPQNQLSPVTPVQDLSPIPHTSGDEAHLSSGNCSKQDAQSDQDQRQVIPVCSNRTKREQSKRGPKEYLQGRVHHVSAETIRDDSPVILGMLLANSYPAMVLFDTGATHSFIAQSFVEHHGIRTSTLKKCMIVSSPGGQLRSHIFCARVSVSIGRVKFSANLMVIDTKGIDVILGMDTLVKWGVRIDCTQRSVHLLASNGQEVTVSATEPSGFLHQMGARPVSYTHLTLPTILRV